MLYWPETKLIVEGVVAMVRSLPTLGAAALVMVTVSFKVRAVASGADSLFPPLAAAVVQSVAVVRVSDGKMLVDIGAEKLLSPASVTKLVTSATALAKFGPSHKFTTRFYLDGRRAGEVLHGNLVIVGDGDPFVVNEKLWQMAADFRHLGIREVTGDIVIDNALFVGPSRDQSRKEGEKVTSHAYDAPVSAFGVNFNTFAVAMAPGLKIGAPATVSIDPYKIQGIVVENALRTVAARQSASVQVSRLTQANDMPRLVVRGGIPLDQGLRKIYRSVDDHVIAAGETVRAFFGREGIRIAGRVREGARPAAAELLYEMPGYDLAYIVSGLNTFSNNYIADVLVERLGAQFGTVGSMESGLLVIAEFLKTEVGLKPTFVLKNGSGLDSANRLSAAQLVRLLSYMESRFDLFPEFLASLPTAGEEGTMEKRLKNGGGPSLKGLVRAKTGSLTEPVSVASLAGYFRHPKHGLVAFAVIENGIPGKVQPSIGDLRTRQDHAIDKLWETL